MKFFILSILTASILLLFSCRSPQDLTYFANIPEAQDGVLNGTTNYDIRLVPDDELLITVNSLVPEATAQFNLPLVNGSSSIQTTGKTVSTSSQFRTYTLDSNGDIVFPVLGKLHISGMSITEVRDMLTAQIAKTVKGPIVQVTLLNFKVNVMGEVQKPSMIEVKRERFSVLDAISAAGDLTAYGKRDGIVLIREENGVKQYHRLRLDDVALISSPYYYLKQNDVIYVEPNNIKKSNSRYDSYNAYKITVISTVVSAVSVIASLVIALCVRK